MRFSKTIIDSAFDKVMKKVSGKNKLDTFIKDRDDLLNRMGVGKKTGDIPLMMVNAIEEVINPYLVSKFHSQFGFPKEMFLEEIEKRKGIKVSDYWNDWCDFWFDSFNKIPHNILCDSKEYYKAMK